MHSGDGSWGPLTHDSKLEGLISSIVSCNNIFKEWGGETRKWVEFCKEWEVAGKTQDMIPKGGGFYSSWIESQWSRSEHERCRRNPVPSNNGEWPPFSWNVWKAVSSNKSQVILLSKACRWGEHHFPGGPVVKLHNSSAERMGSIPGQGTKIPHAKLCNLKRGGKLTFSSSSGPKDMEGTFREHEERWGRACLLQERSFRADDFIVEETMSHWLKRENYGALWG